MTRHRSSWLPRIAEAHAHLAAVVLAGLGSFGCSASSAIVPADAGGGGGGGDAGGGGGGADAGAAMTWALTDLGPGRCVSVNSHGQVLGSDENGATFIVTSGKSRSDLGPFLAGVPAIGEAIDESGDVVGTAESTTARITIRFTGGHWEAVGGLAGATWSAGLGIGGDGERWSTTSPLASRRRETTRFR